MKEAQRIAPRTLHVARQKTLHVARQKTLHVARQKTGLIDQKRDRNNGDVQPRPKLLGRTHPEIEIGALPNPRSKLPNTRSKPEIENAKRTWHLPPPQSVFASP